MSQTTSKFKELLGAETAGGWVVFMDEVKAELPFLFEPGRPTRQQIADSEIGRAGHESWSDYVEKTLGWKMSSWRAWMRSYKIILEHEYLRDLDLTASAIRTASKDAGDSFPATPEEFAEMREKIEAEQKMRQENSLSEAKRVNDLLRAEIERLKGRMQGFDALPWYKKILFKFGE